MDMKTFNPNLKINEFCGIKDSKINFMLQDGPIKEVGVNGAQIDDLIELCREIIFYFGNRFPSGFNDIAIKSLDIALGALAMRKEDREKRNVEGLDKR